MDRYVVRYDTGHGVLVDTKNAEGVVCEDTDSPEDATLGRNFAPLVNELNRLAGDLAAERARAERAEAEVVTMARAFPVLNDLDALATTDIGDPAIRESVSLRLLSRIVGELGESVLALFPSAKNYVEFDVERTSRDGSAAAAFRVTLQRAEGKSPDTLRAEAVAERDAALARIAKLEAVAEAARACDRARAAILAGGSGMVGDSLSPQLAERDARRALAAALAAIDESK